MYLEKQSYVSTLSYSIKLSLISHLWFSVSKKTLLIKCIYLFIYSADNSASLRLTEYK